MRFSERVAALPRLGFGLSTEHGAGDAGTAPLALRRARPDLVDFLEIGADVARGFDEHTRGWIAAGGATTYHFLDVNLEEPEDLDDAWLTATLDQARAARAAWLCGDAGLWHVGPRDLGHGTLLPPILCASSLSSMTEAVIALRERSGYEVLPENPPAHVLVGDLSPLAYFGALAERADCGLLLDVAHLAITQRALGVAPTALLDEFPVERVVEVHVAGGTPFAAGGRTLIHDDHGPRVHDDTWLLLEAVVARATSLKAVVVECERNSLDDVIALFEAVRARVGTGWGRAPAPARLPSIPSADPVDHRRVQRTLFRMLLDPRYAAEVRRRGAPELGPVASGWLQAADPELIAADAGDVRLQQLLGNVVLEFVHTVRAAPDLVAPFVRSPEFHAAIADDTPLPLAFGAYASRRLPPTGLPRALITLDRAMCALRRAPDAPSAWLSPRCRVVTVQAGTVAAAQALRSDEPPEPLGSGREHVLLVAGEIGPAGRREVQQVEVVPEPLAELLQVEGWGDGARRELAERHEVEAAALDELVAELRADGILVEA